MTKTVTSPAMRSSPIPASMPTADVAAMVDLSKRTMINIRQNIAVALGLKAVFLVTTVVGLTGLWPAILADTGATVLVTMNALRLLRLPTTEPFQS